MSDTKEWFGKERASEEREKNGNDDVTSLLLSESMVLEKDITTCFEMSGLARSALAMRGRRTERMTQRVFYCLNLWLWTLCMCLKAFM